MGSWNYLSLSVSRPDLITRVMGWSMMVSGKRRKILNSKTYYKIVPNAFAACMFDNSKLRHDFTNFEGLNCLFTWDSYGQPIKRVREPQFFLELQKCSQSYCMYQFHAKAFILSFGNSLEDMMQRNPWISAQRYFRFHPLNQIWFSTSSIN